MVEPLTEYAARLQQAMRAAGHDPDSPGAARWLSAALGTSYQAARKAIAGSTKMLRADNNTKAAQALDVDPDWLATGVGQAHWTPAHHPSVGPMPPGVAQAQSHPQFQDAPTHIAWERILVEPLKPEFQTVMPDASMEPQVPRGARVIFVTGVEPVPGDWVLCKDADGNLYLRELRQLRPGRWEAHALNPAFLPMDSISCGLQVVAVYDGQRGRKGSA